MRVPQQSVSVKRPVNPLGRSMKIKAICFDMDGTLIRNTDSVRYLCTLNDNLKELEEIECFENERSISWTEADYLKAELIRGLELGKVEDRFEDNVELIQNIGQVLTYLRGRRIRSVLVTAGPTQVADILGMKFGFDGVYGSIYEVKNQKFTGQITTHMGNAGKLNRLEHFCDNNSIRLNHCVAIGDGESDVDVFGKCGKSIAINFTDTLEGKASEYVTTNDLSDIIDILESWLAA
ncbi:HAD family hydrolase [Thermodesulfobacteriota bacterium]